MAFWITFDIVSRLVSPSGVKVKLIPYDVTTAIIALLVGEMIALGYGLNFIA